MANSSFPNINFADVPGRKNKSVLVIEGQMDVYTEEELDRLEAFGARLNRYFDERGGRVGVNAVIMAKTESGSWFNTKMTWTQGRMFSNSLDEALEYMARAYGEENYDLLREPTPETPAFRA